MTDTTQNKADIALVGLGTMGRALALNMGRNNFTVACYDRSREFYNNFFSEMANDKRFLPVKEMADLKGMLKTPRLVFLMITAGKPVDDVIEGLLPVLEKGDIIIDGGNSLFTDTTRRTKYLESKGLQFIGTGVSGGEQGALWGPAIMPGGSPAAWPHAKGILQSIAAKTADGTPCCDWIGKEGAGHFVKMVHNGIEYADMQLIAESYFLMKNALGMNNEEIAETFRTWNKGELNSYLIGMTSDVLTQKDTETDNYLIDVILDAARQKGTGKWTVEAALDLGVPIPSIAEAVFARNISALKEERVEAEKLFARKTGKYKGDRAAFVDAISQAMFASKLCVYAQGFAILRAASKEYGWDLNFGRLALLWREGCIIRARFLERIKDAFDRQPQLPNLLLDSFFKEAVSEGIDAWRKVLGVAMELGYSTPAFSSSLQYFDSYTCGRLPANLTQGQRDYFGAHTFERTDKPGTFHVEWTVSQGE